MSHEAEDLHLDQGVTSVRSSTRRGMPRGRPPISSQNSSRSSESDKISEDEQEDVDVGRADRDYKPVSYRALRRRVAEYQTEYDYEPEPSIPDPNVLNKQQQSFQPWLLYLIVALILALVGCWNFSEPVDNNATVVDQTLLRNNLKDNMRNVRDKFPSQMKNIWYDFFSGITKVLFEEPTEPTVFLLIHQDAATTSCLAHQVARVAHDFLNATEPSPLVVDGAALGRDAALLEDYGQLITVYRPLVEQHRIMILDNLQAVPATLARALHFFCDTVTPMVSKAVYIFTLNVGDVEGSPTRVAERELNSVWRQLDGDILSPLVVRITGGSVLKIRHEEGMANVC